MLTKNINIIDDTQIMQIIINLNNHIHNLNYKIYHFDNKKIYKLYGINYLIKYNLSDND